MNNFLSLYFILILLIFTSGSQEWVVIVAGSRGYDNYRHQSDVAHFYQIAKKHGIPDTQIITMFFDDIAHDPLNPFIGQLFNKPAEKIP